jgi:FixJ family two-component response regulator
MNPSEPTVFIVDDDDRLRDALQNYLHTAGIQAESFASAEEFLQAFDPARPGCIVLDIRMPGMGGLELQSTLVDQGHTIPVIVVTGYADVPVTIRSIQAGAVILLEKPFSSATLLGHIQDAFERDKGSRAERSRHKKVADKFAALTVREREVIGLLAAGNSNAMIAEQLGISARTVETYRSRIMLKTQVGSVAELVRLSISAGLVSLNEAD